MKISLNCMEFNKRSIWPDISCLAIVSVFARLEIKIVFSVRIRTDLESLLSFGGRKLTYGFFCVQIEPGILFSYATRSFLMLN